MEKLLIDKKRLEKDKKFLSTFQYRGKEVNVPKEELSENVSNDQRIRNKIYEDTLGL